MDMHWTCDNMRHARYINSVERWISRDQISELVTPLIVYSRTLTLPPQQCNSSLCYTMAVQCPTTGIPLSCSASLSDYFFCEHLLQLEDWWLYCDIFQIVFQTFPQKWSFAFFSSFSKYFLSQAHACLILRCLRWNHLHQLDGFHRYSTTKISGTNWSFRICFIFELHSQPSTRSPGVFTIYECFM